MTVAIAAAGRGAAARPVRTIDVKRTDHDVALGSCFICSRFTRMG